MADTPIPADDLPKTTPGTLDSVVGVDESTGEARRFALADLPGAPEAIAAAEEAAASAESAANSASSVAGYGYATLALLNADLTPGDGAIRMVTNDPTPANNGAWRKSGASGSGSWVQSADRVSGLEQDVVALQSQADESTDALAGHFIGVGGSAYKYMSELLADYDALWFDASVAGDVAQDVAGSSPVTASGQTAKFFRLNKTGNMPDSLVAEYLDLSTHSFSGTASVSADATTGSDGATTVDKLVEGTGTGLHGANKSVLKEIGATYRYTAVVKQAGRTKLRIAANGSVVVDVDLSAGTLIQEAGGAELVSIASAGNGFYEVVFDAIAAAVSETSFLLLLNVSGSSSYTGDGSSGIYFESLKVTKAPAFVQATAGKQPLYIVDADGRSALRFDGGNDAMAAVGIDFSETTKVTMCFAIKQYEDASTESIIEHGSSASGGFAALLSNTAPAGSLGGAITVDASNKLFSNATGASAPRTLVGTVILDPAAATDDDRIRIRVNGEDVDETQVSVAGSVSTAAFGLRAMYLGSRLGTSLFAEIDVFAGAVVAGGMTEGDLVALERTLAYKSGATLRADSAAGNELNPAAFSDSSAPVKNGSHYFTSAFASVDFQTEATALEVTTFNDLFNTYPAYTTIGVYVDGAFNQTISPASEGTIEHAITLPAGNKLVSLVNGLQSRPVSANPVKGSYVVSVRADVPIAQVLAPARNRTLIYGDSIAVGGNAANPDQNAWVMLLRAAAYPSSVAVEGWGYRSLYDDANTATLRKAFANKLCSYDPRRIWLAIGTNDYGLNKWNAAAFGAAYAALLDDLHTRLPGVTIYCQTPLLRSSETANGSGSTLGDYRTQIATAVSARAAYCILVDGTAILTTADLADGVHPTTAGHGLYADYVKNVLGL